MTVSKKVKPLTEELSKSERMWNRLKDEQINIFGLPNQKVSDHAKPVLAFKEELYLTLSTQVMLPVLEEKLRSITFEDSKLAIEMRAGHAVISTQK